METINFLIDDETGVIVSAMMRGLGRSKLEENNSQNVI